ncbi:MAG TPA: choice-of-anchor V domain-containing protein [Candidatus Acidoferrum sp.]|nr:choice-of-anchor V domain-containing protein [Candidatus Acidoferrum sp.]
MTRNRKLIVAKVAIALAAVPFLLWAHEYGPDPGYCGVPKENASCISSGCHVGTANDPANKGSVKVTFPNGTSYVPGVTQHLVVTIDDPVQHAWGFQLTARLSGNNSATMGGSFAFTDVNTQLMCSSANLAQLRSQCLSTNPADGCSNASTTCPSNMPLQYMEHTLSGYNASRGKSGPQTYEFDWTPPATASGNIDFYVAGNAANGDLTERGDHIYTTKFTLTPGAAGPVPAISANGVVNGASFQPGIVPGSWMTIQGTNLSPTTDTWDKFIVNGKLPTSVDGVTVNVGGKPAFVYFISPTQINALAPDAGTGSLAVTVGTPSGTSAVVNATSQTLGPAFFLWPGNQPVATRNADGSFAVKPGTFTGATTVAAKPGDVLLLWGTGFGPTNPAVTSGEQTPADKLYNTASPVTVTINNTPATVVYAVLSPGFAGLYQVAIQVPASLADGDWPIKASIGSFQSPDGIVLSVKK